MNLRTAKKARVWGRKRANCPFCGTLHDLMDTTPCIRQTAKRLYFVCRCCHEAFYVTKKDWNENIFADSNRQRARAETNRRRNNNNLNGTFTVLELADILGFRACSESDLKRNFRKLAMKYHPDKGGRTEMFQEINNIYQSRK